MSYRGSDAHQCIGRLHGGVNGRVPSRMVCPGVASAAGGEKARHHAAAGLRFFPLYENTRHVYFVPRRRVPLGTTRRVRVVELEEQPCGSRGGSSPRTAWFGADPAPGQERPQAHPGAARRRVHDRLPARRQRAGVHRNRERRGGGPRRPADICGVPATLRQPWNLRIRQHWFQELVSE